MSSYLKAAIMCFLVFLFISSFAQTKKRHIAPKATSKEEVEIDSNWDVLALPDISPNKIGTIGLELNDPFNADEALYKLFPGYHYPKYQDHTWALWRSTNYPATKMSDDMEDPHMFPGKRRNLTCVNNINRFKDDSRRQNILISFESNELSSLDVLYCGRYSGADISVALFTKYGNKWVLKNFTMGMACYGSYHHAEQVDKIKLGADNYGCTIFQRADNPGGPGVGHIHIYGLVKGQYKEILVCKNAARYMRMYGSEWGTSIKREEHGLKFDDLKLVTTGDFNRAAFDTANKYISISDTAIDVPKEVYANTATTDSFLFSITRVYHFKENKYRLASSHKHVFAVQPRTQSGLSH